MQSRFSAMELEYVSHVTGMQPHHKVCRPAHLVHVSSQDKVGGLRQEGHLA